MPDNISPGAPSLWSFTLDRYAKPGVQDAAIALQNNQNADVNFLFFCTWAAATRREPLTAAMFEAAESRVSYWREQITKPLRGLRDHIKADPMLAGLEGAMDTRGKILGAEIESERIAQIVIEATASVPLKSNDSSPVAMAKNNLRAYLAFIHADMDQEADNQLHLFIQGVFPGV